MRGQKVRSAQSRAGQFCGHSCRRLSKGIEIVMECDGCDTVPSLENARCFGGAIRAIQLEGATLAVTLRTHIERRYGPVATRSLCMMADIRNRVNDLHSQMERLAGNGGECSGCVEQLAGRLAAIGHAMDAMDVGRALATAGSLASIGFGMGRSGCADCADMTLVQTKDIAKSAGEIERSLIRSAFNIVGVG